MDKKTFIFELYDKITGPLGKILNDTVDRVAKGFKAGLGAAADVASGFRDRVGDAFLGASVRLWGFLGQMSGWAARVGGAIGGAASNFRDRFAEAIRSADARLPGFLARVHGWALGVRSAIEGRFGAISGVVSRSFGSMVSSLRSLAPNAFDMLGKLGARLTGGPTKIPKAPAASAAAGGASTLETVANLSQAAGVGVVQVASALGSAAAAGMKFVASQESTRIAMGARLGAPRAQEVMTRSTTFAAKTPFDTTAVTEWYAQLAEQGRSNQEIESVLTAAADLSARSGFDPKVMDNLVASFARGGQKGNVDLSALENAGLPKEVVDRLQKAAGGSNASLSTVLAAVQSQVSGGNLGSLMAQGRSSGEGVFTRLQSLPQEIFAGIDQQPGFKVFKDFLENLVNVLSPATASGQALRNVFFEFFNGALGLLQGLTGPAGLEKMQNILGIITTVVQGLGLVFKVAFAVLGWVLEADYQLIMIIWGGIQWVGEAIGFVAFKIWEAWQAISDFFGKVSAIAASMWEAGTQIVRGLVDGIMSGLSALGEGVGKLYGTVVGGIKSLFKMGSPSKVLRELGLYTVAGFEQGLEQGAPGADSALTAAIDVPSVPRPGAASAVLPNINITVNANGEGARDIAERVRAATLEALQSAFEQLALEQGVA